MLYRKRCPKCRKEFTSSSRLEIADIEFCDECHTSLPVGFEEFDPDAALEQSSANPNAEDEGTPEDNQPDELELVYIGTAIIVQLPRMAGVVGRVPVNCDAIKTFSTISRKQFTYVNNSQYGTVAQGVFLDVGESMVLTPPAVIEMGGCYSFELRKKGA